MGLFLKKWAKYSVRLCLVIGFHYLCIKFTKMMEEAQQVIDYMLSMRNERQREVLMRFFKTAPGEYGEGDEFLGLKVPQTRAVMAEAKDLPLDEVPVLTLRRPTKGTLSCASISTMPNGPIIGIWWTSPLPKFSGIGYCSLHSWEGRVVCTNSTWTTNGRRSMDWRRVLTFGFSE